MELLTQVAIFTFISIVTVTGIYILTGLTGMFSLGQAAFMAIGAYASATLVVKMGMPFGLAAVIAILISVAIGFIVGLPTVHLRRDYISLVTLGFGEAITALLNQMVSVTGGANGFSGIPPLTTFSLALVSAVMCVVLVAFFKKSRFGRQCIAIKNDEFAAKSMGINVARVKMTAFLISVAFTAYSGVLYGFFTTYVDPSMFGWKKSAEWVIMVFFGGVNSLTGSIFSAVVLTALPQALQSASEYSMLIYSVLVLLIINFRPAGIFGEYELTISNIKKLFVHKKREGKKNVA
jgi:ABC-type branched-chain amino acid transport system, permease component